MLLIEDQPTTRAVLLQKLRTAGFDVDVAPNPHLGLEKLESCHPDAIFMDLLLPFIKGVDVIKKARQDPEFGDRPIYVCTNAALMKTWSKRGLAAGANKVFNKGVTRIDEIVEAVAADLLQSGTTFESATLPPLAEPFLEPARPSPSEPKAPAPSPSPIPPPHESQPPPPQAIVQTTPAARSTANPLTLMKQAFKNLDLFRHSKSPKRASAAAPPPLPPEPTPPTAIPAPDAPATPATPATPQAPPSPADLWPGFQSAEPTPLTATPASPVAPSQAAPGVIQFVPQPAESAAESPVVQFGPQPAEPAAESPVVQSGPRPAEPAAESPDLQFGPRPAEPAAESPVVQFGPRPAEPAAESPVVRFGPRPAELAAESSVVQFGPRPSELAAAPAAIQSVPQPAERAAAPTPAMPRTAPPMPPGPEPAGLTRDTTMMYREAVAKYANERDGLVERIFAAETELDKTRAELARENEGRKAIEEHVQTLTALKAELEKQVAQEVQSKEELLKFSAQFHGELDEIKSAAERTQAALAEKEAQCTQLDEELTSLRRQHDELSGMFAAEQHALAEARDRNEELEGRLREGATETERISAALKQQTEERERGEEVFRRQWEEAKATIGQTQSALAEKEAQSRQFEQALASLRQAHDELNATLAAQHRTAEEATARQEELECRLHDGAGELERAKGDLAKQVEERQRSVAEVLGRLNASQAAAGQAQSALTAKAAECDRLQRELAGLWLEHDRLDSRFADFRKRHEELEQRLRERTAQVERVQADLKQTTEQRTRAEADWQEQLSAAKAAIEAAQATVTQKDAQRRQLEEELAGLRQARNELNSKFSAEQQAAADSRKHNEALDQRLRESTAQLERAQADLHKATEDRKRADADWQQQLSAAKAATEAAQATITEKETQRRQLEEELAGLRQAQNELNTKFSAGQQAAAEARTRNEELEQHLRDSSGQLERAQADLHKATEERTRSEAEWHRQLGVAKAATEAALATLNERDAQRRQFEEELAGLRRAHCELNKNFTAEQQEAASSKRRIKELEQRLHANVGELDQAKADLVAVHAANEAAQANLSEKDSQRRQLTEELAGLRQAHDQLNQNLAAEQEAVAEARQHHQELENRLRASAADLDRVKTDLAAVQAGYEAARANLTDEDARRRQLDEELAGLRQAHDQLNQNFAAEQQAVAEARQQHQELENRLCASTADLDRVKAELLAAHEANQAAHANLAEKDAKHRRLEEELAGMRQARDAWNSKFTAEQQTSAASKHRIKELEKLLGQTAKGLETAKGRLEKQAADRGKLESEFRGKLNEAKASVQQAEAAVAEKVTLCGRLEEELAGLRQKHDELGRQLLAGQQGAAAAQERTAELEKQLRESLAELERVKADRENQAAERARLESEFRSFAETKDSLGKELCRLHESETAHQAELSEVDRRLREGVAALARTTADLEEERASRRQIEQRAAELSAHLQELHDELKSHLESERAGRGRITELEQFLRERDESLARSNADLVKEAADRQLAEDQLRATADMSAQLRKYLSLFEDAKKVFQRTQDDLESRLQSTLKTLRDTESRLVKEASDRRRLEEAVELVQRESHEQSQRSALELSKLESALQVEQLQRQHLEGDAIQSRYASLDSTRVGRALVNGFRRQLREPVDGLMQSVRRLFELDLGANEKKLVESVLENALLLQTSLQDTGTPSSPAGGGRGEGQPELVQPVGSPTESPGDKQP